jgi:hypothetical protein
MGWLFAVSMGMQERSRGALLRAVPFIALGHEGAVALMVGVLVLTSSLFAAKAVVLTGGTAVLGFGLWQLVRRRHPRWAGMQLTPWQLAGWSFVMSSAHGAGLMLLPVFVFPVHEHLHDLSVHHGLGQVTETAVLTSLLHVGAMAVTCGMVALLVYEVVGLAPLRRLWIDVDRVWTLALVGAGAATLLTA